MSIETILIIWIIGSILTGLLANKFKWAIPIFWIFMLAGFVFVIIGIAYAWIINPLNGNK